MYTYSVALSSSGRKYARTPDGVASKKLGLRVTLLPPGVVSPSEAIGSEPVYHLFVARVTRRDAFRAHLAERGVSTAVHYPIPLHLQPAFRYLGLGPGSFPIAERLSSEVVSLPMHPFLDRSQVQYIADAAAEFLRA